MGFRGPLFGTLVFYFFFAPPAIRSHTWRAPTSELLPRLKAAQRFASGRAAGGLLFRKCQVQPVLLTADEEHTLNEFHRRQFVGDHRKRRSLLRASTMASNSLVNFRCPRKLIRRPVPGWSVLPAVACLSKVATNSVSPGPQAANKR
ncbi:uncharacterized protein LOC119183991 [Rhipicephalus microplus]|uniref:uncharacterized protein LOC119183991 n=1 Tax=Rhipicephalus microplus TaxID=6941 RepID=UPI003F6CEEBD